MQGCFQRISAVKFLVLGLLLTSFSSLGSNPFQLARTVSAMMEVAGSSGSQAAISAAAVTRNLFQIAVSNSVAGVSLTDKEINLLRNLKSFSNEGAITSALGEARAKELLEGLKVTLATHNLFYLKGRNLNKFRKYIISSSEDSKRLFSKFNDRISSDAAYLNKIFDTKTDKIINSAYKNVDESVVTNAKVQLKSLVDAGIKAKSKSIYNLYQKVGVVRSQIEGALTNKFKMPIRYWSVGKNGACSVVKNLPNLLKIDQAFQNGLKSFKGNVDSLQVLLKSSVAKVITNGNLPMAKEVIKGIQKSNCRNYSFAVAGF